MRIGKLISELNEIQDEYGDKEIVFVKYGSSIEGDYDYGHLLTNNEKDRQDQNASLMATHMELTDEIELYTTTE